MSRLMGLDISLVGTGVVTIDAQLPVGLVPAKNEIIDMTLISSSPKEETTPRIMKIANSIREKARLLIPQLIVIEGPAFGVHKTSSIFTLGELTGVTKTYLQLDGFRFIIVPPSVIKKWVTGKGNAKKDLMLMKVYKKYGIEFEDDNLCDAFVLAKYGVPFVNPILRRRANGTY